MKKQLLIAVPAAAVIGIAGVGAAAALSDDAVADPGQESAAAEANQSEQDSALTKAELKKQKEADRVKKTAKLAGISKKDVKKYAVTTAQAKEIRQATNWASGGQVEAVRQCESGGNYATNTGNGYYGAYQFDAGTWRSVGGAQYAPYASQAPKVAQDHMAWTLWSRAGWGPWGCA